MSSIAGLEFEATRESLSQDGGVENFIAWEFTWCGSKFT